MRRRKFRGIGGSRVYKGTIRGRQNGNPGFNRRSFKLKQKRVVNRPEEWIRAEGVFEAIVEPQLFFTVQGMIRERNRRFSDEGHEGCAGRLRSIEGFETRDNPGQVGCRLSWGQRRTGIGRQNRGARRLIFKILSTAFSSRLDDDAESIEASEAAYSGTDPGFFHSSFIRLSTCKTGSHETAPTATQSHR